MQKQINPVPTKILIPIFLHEGCFKQKHFITVALNIDDNKIKIYDFLINIEYVYYAGLKEIMINVLKELRSMKTLSDDHPDCELIHPEG